MNNQSPMMNNQSAMTTDSRHKMSSTSQEGSFIKEQIELRQPGSVVPSQYGNIGSGDEECHQLIDKCLTHYHSEHNSTNISIHYNEMISNMIDECIDAINDKRVDKIEDIIRDRDWILKDFYRLYPSHSQNLYDAAFRNRDFNCIQILINNGLTCNHVGIYSNSTLDEFKRYIELGCPYSNIDLLQAIRLDRFEIANYLVDIDILLLMPNSIIDKKELKERSDTNQEYQKIIDYINDG